MGTLARLGLVAIAASLGACATSYAPESIWNDGGYSEKPSAPDAYNVWFIGNVRTPPEKSDDLAVLRAADLCVANARPFMQLRNFTSGPLSVHAPLSRTIVRRSQIGMTSGVNSAPYFPVVAVTTITGKPMIRTRSGLEVVCLTEAGDGTRDSARTAEAIRQRYGITSDSAR